jgi:hypothetical protein
MPGNNIFYYPYASFTNAQLPLLKAAALYFDKLIILDPVDASWDTIGAEFYVRDAVQMLKEAGILKIVTPSEILKKFEDSLYEAIRSDMSNAEFLALCDAHARESGKDRWTLSLAKVPKDMQTDQAMRQLMGNFARDVANKTAYAADDYIEHVNALSSLPGNEQPIPNSVVERLHQYQGYAESGKTYDEYREGYEGDVEYRYADFPLALGEAIMLNHALLAGLLHSEATPLTDESFHSKLLDLKLSRAHTIPAVRQVLESRARRSQMKVDDFVFTALQDSRFNLPVLNPALPLQDILEYRRKHADSLGDARETLATLAQGIKSEPWTEDFRDALESGPLKDLRQKLGDVRKARDSWQRSKRAKLALGAAGIGVAAATATLSLLVAPITPIALAAAGLSLASGVAIPGAEWLIDWRDGKKGIQENGLHYLLKL